MKHYIIGCGGVGSYFLPPFLKTLKHIRVPRLRTAPVVLVDGDVLEEKNLARQLFDASHVGLPKVEALAATLAAEYPAEKLSALPTYIDSSFEPDPGSMLLVFCDNHPARRAALSAADRCRCTVVIAANSSVGAQAYYYHYEWAGTPRDPRVRFPDILTDESDSPLQAGIGCASVENLDANPQTPLANFQAAAHALLIWNFYVLEAAKLDRAMTEPFWPVEFNNTASAKGALTTQALAA